MHYFYKMADICKVYVRCLKISTHSTMQPLFYIALGTNIIIYSEQCKDCNFQFLSDISKELLNTLFQIGGKPAVREYMNTLGYS